jgi:apolipoprotein N-acyltransferase
MTVRALLVVLSAGLHALALPPWGWSALAWVALVPFFCALRGLGPLMGALVGLVWGTVAVWGIGYWVPVALATYYQQPWWFGVLFALAASVVFAGSYAAGFAACAAAVAAPVSAIVRPILLAVLWVSWELARARVLTGDPWILFGYALMPELAVIQIADLGGIYAVSFVAVFVNASLAELCTRPFRGWRPTLALLGVNAAVLTSVLAYGATRLATAAPTAPAIPVTIVQGNNDVGRQWRSELYGEGLREYLAMSAAAVSAHKSELIVWPESAVTFFLAREPVHRSLIERALEGLGADLILGGPHNEDGDPRYFNSAFYMPREGGIASRYDKVHLLPFAEYFPLRTIELLRRNFEQVRYFTAGVPGDVLSTRFGDVATVICFEGIFPELVRAQTARGAGLLVNLSNDVWLGPGAGPEQHLSMVALRAVENRLWVVRATTSGISAFIDPSGRVVSRTEFGVAAVLNGTIVPMHGETIYKRFGDAFAYGCLALSVIVVGAVVSRARRKPDQSLPLTG